MTSNKQGGKKLSYYAHFAEKYSKLKGKRHSQSRYSMMENTHLYRQQYKHEMIKCGITDRG